MNQAKLFLLMMQHILMVKIQLKRTISDKILQNRAYEIARNCNYDRYQRALGSMVCKFFNKKTGSGVNVNELAKELHKPVTKKLKRRKVYVRFKDNIWAADLDEMVLLSSENKILNTYYVSKMFSLNMHGLNL